MSRKITKHKFNPSLAFTLALTILTLTYCSRPIESKKTDKFYYSGSCFDDTTRFDKPSFDIAKLRAIDSVEFFGELHRKVLGQVIKLTNEPAPIDGGEVYYFTTDLGIIYRKSTTWPCFTRLHSTNDSIEKRINDYLAHILSKPYFVMEGEVEPIMTRIKFTPPTVDK